MKILYVTALNETINAFLVQHICRLIEDGNEVHCACNINRKINKELIKNKVVYHSVDFGRNPLKINYIKVINDIKNLYEKNNYDIVHVHTPIAAFLTRLALRNYDVKIIYTAHGFHFFKGGSIKNWILYYPLEKVAAHWTDKIVTINDEDYKMAKTFKLRNNGKVELMHGVGINLLEYNIENFNRDCYREKLGVKKSDFMILILADINKNKNHSNVIKAIKELSDTYNNIKVICAGEGPLRLKLAEEVNNSILKDNIKFLGFRNDVKELLNSCDCVGLFSMREGLPKSLMEAMCCGKPIVASDIRGCRDLARNDVVGKLVNPRDYKSIAEGITEIMNNSYNPISIKNEVRIYDINKVLDEVSIIHSTI